MLAAMSPTGKVEDGWDYVTRVVENLDGKFASGSSAAYKAVVEGDKLRVSSASRDVLQQVIAFLKDQDYGQPLQYVNYR